MSNLKRKVDGLQDRVDQCIGDIETQLRVKVGDLLNKREYRAVRIMVEFLEKNVPFNRKWVAEEFDEVKESLEELEKDRDAKLAAYQDAIDRIAKATGYEDSDDPQEVAEHVELLEG